MADWLFCCASRERVGDEDAKAGVNKLDEEKPLLEDGATKNISPVDANVTQNHADEESSQTSPKAGRKERSASFMQKLGNYGCFCAGDELSPKNKRMPSAGDDSPSKDNLSLQKKEEKAPEKVKKEEEQTEPEVEPKAQLAEQPADKAEEIVEVKEEPSQVKPEETKKAAEPEQPQVSSPTETSPTITEPEPAAEPAAQSAAEPDAQPAEQEDPASQVEAAGQEEATATQEGPNAKKKKVDPNAKKRAAKKAKEQAAKA